MDPRTLLLAAAAISTYTAGDLFVCSEKLTTCPSDTIISSDLTACLPIAFNGHGESCEDNVQCSARLLAGGVCIDGTCQCKDGYHYLYGQCWQSRGLGDECTKDEDCFAHSDNDAMTCGADNKCICGDGAYQRDASTCRRVAHLNESCDLHDDCRAAKPTLECVDNVCRELGEQEAWIALPPRVWSGGTKRRRNATCSGPNESPTPGGQCVCDRGFFRPATQQPCVPELGQSCVTVDDCPDIPDVGELQCRSSASGVGSICACSGGFVPNIANRLCLKTRKYNFNCVEDAICSYYGGVCEEGSCVCPAGTRYLEDEINCWPNRALGEPCDVTKDCSVASGVGVTCLKSQCQCESGYHKTSDGDCWPDALGFGAPCKEDADCPFGDGAVCGDEAASGLCSCGPSYYQSTDGDPECLTGVGGPCESSKCAVINTTCVTECVQLLPGFPCQNVSECRCLDGFVGSTNFSECLPELHAFGDNCTETAQCSAQMGAMSLCVDGACTCSEGSHFSAGFCWKSRMLGQTCDSSPQCYLEKDLHLAECRNSICECWFDWSKQPDRELCERVSGKAARHVVAALSLLFWILVARII